MIYGGKINTTANTSIAEALETRIQAVKGFIHHISLYFPPGPSGLVGVRASISSFQFFPRTHSEWFIADNVHFSFDESMFIDNPSAEITVDTYNLDTEYDHDIYIWFGVVLEDTFIARYVPTLTADYFREMLTVLKMEDSAKTDAEHLAAVQSLSDFSSIMGTREDTKMSVAIYNQDNLAKVVGAIPAHGGEPCFQFELIENDESYWYTVPANKLLFLCDIMCHIDNQSAAAYRGYSIIYAPGGSDTWWYTATAILSSKEHEHMSHHFDPPAELPAGARFRHRSYAASVAVTDSLYGFLIDV